MSRITGTKFFTRADKGQGGVALGADFTLVIGGYEHLTFSIQTHALPMLKNEKVEFTSTHGVKMSEDGYIQTLNDIPVTFMERNNAVVKKTLEEILLSGDNGSLELRFYQGRTVESTNLWGKMVFSSIFIEDNPEADVESTTAPLKIQASITGHYEPNGDIVNATDLTLNALSGFA